MNWFQARKGLVLLFSVLAVVIENRGIYWLIAIDLCNQILPVYFAFDSVLY